MAEIPKTLEELSTQAGVDVGEVQKNIDIKGTTPEAGIGNVLSLAKKGAAGVSLLSTENAANKVEKMKSDLDEMTPVEPVKPTKPVEPATPVEPVKEEKKEKYTLEEASEMWGNDFTGLRRNEDGTYTPIEGIGPDGKQYSPFDRLGITGAESDTEFKDAEQASADAIAKENARAQEIADYDFTNDPALKSQQDAITQEYAKYIKDMERINASRLRGIQATGMRGGTTRYAGDIQSGIEGAELDAGSSRIQELVRQKNTAIANATSAYKTGKWQEFAVQMEALGTIRENTTDALDKMTKALASASKIQLDKEQAEIDQKKKDNLRSGILEALDLGYTDPIDILSALQQAGIDADPADVTKYTNLIENEDLLAGLSGEAKIYEWYRINNPEWLDSMGITNPLDWMKAVGEAGRKATGGGGGTGGGGTTDVIPTNINEAVSIAAQQLVEMRNNGQLNDLVYDQYIKGLMADWGIEPEREGEVKSLLNQAMQGGVGQQEDVASDFETFVSAPASEFKTGEAQAGEEVRKGAIEAGKTTGNLLKDFIPSLIALTGEAGSYLTNFAKGVIGDKNEITEEDKQKVYKALGVTK